ncbi:MAG: hypothetical protein D6790_06450 [Caldilineae bacterium]|nr:MAG: hypothetical protein D6790_06450 [Caldilineae bacterium]
MRNHTNIAAPLLIIHMLVAVLMVGPCLIAGEELVTPMAAVALAATIVVILLRDIIAAMGRKDVLALDIALIITLSADVTATCMGLVSTFIGWGIVEGVFALALTFAVGMTLTLFLDNL